MKKFKQNMKKTGFGLRLLGLGLCVAILLTCSMSAFSSLHAKKKPDFTSYTKLLFQEQLSGDTIGLHYTLAHPEDYGITSHDISLGCLDESNILSTRLSCENIRSMCESFDYDKLSTDDKLTYDILSYTLDQNLEGCNYYYYEEPLNPINGIQAELPVLMAEYTFREASDINDYLMLLEKVPEYFLQIQDFEEKKASKGLFMPTFAADNIISQISSLLDDPSFSCLRETFPGKLETVPGLTEEKQQAYVQAHETRINEYLVPAYGALRDTLTRLRDTSENEGGLCHFPEGSS